MPIPTYDVLMLPVLRLCAEKLWAMHDLVVRVADDLRLTQPEREQMIPNGTMTVITSRVHWAKTYLKQAGLVEQPKRAYVQISERGREVLAQNPSKIDTALLQKFDDFRDFLSRTKSVDAPPVPYRDQLIPKNLRHLIFKITSSDEASKSMTNLNKDPPS